MRHSSAHFSVSSSRDAGYHIVVSKKIARLSVTRHRIKRRVRAALHSLGLDKEAVAIFPKAEVKDMEYDELKRELKELLS